MATTTRKLWDGDAWIKEGTRQWRCLASFRSEGAPPPGPEFEPDRHSTYRYYTASTEKHIERLAAIALANTDEVYGAVLIYHEELVPDPDIPGNGEWETIQTYEMTDPEEGKYEV